MNDSNHEHIRSHPQISSNTLRELQEFISVITRSAEQKSFLDQCLSRLSEIFRVPLAEVMLFQAPQNKLDVFAHQLRNLSMGLWQRSKQERLEWANRVIALSSPLVINDTEKAYAILKPPPPDSSQAFRAILAVPLAIRGQNLGTLSLYDTQPHQFTPAETYLISTISIYVALALEHFRLSSAVTEMIERFNTLQKISTGITSHVDLDTVIETILRSAISFFRTDGGVVLLYDASSDHFTVHKRGGYRRPFNLPPRFSRVKTIAGFVLDYGEPIAFADAENDERLDPDTRRFSKGTKAFLIAPMKIASKSIGLLYVENFRVHQFSDEDLQFISILANAAAVAIENSEMFNQIKQISLTDSLTGIANKRRIDAVLENEVARARRYSRPLSILVVDVDKFGRINEILGYAYGDIILKTLARVISENTRQCDLVGRYGDEEFIIILPETTREQAFVVAEKTRSAIETMSLIPSDYAQTAPKITLSIGIASFPIHSDAASFLISAADEAMFNARDAGGNRICEAAISKRPANP